MTDKSLKMTRMGEVLRIAKKLYVPMPDATAGDKAVPKKETGSAQIVKETQKEFHKFTRDPYKPKAIEDFHVQRVRCKMYGVKHRSNLKLKASPTEGDYSDEEARITERLREATSTKNQLMLQLQSVRSLKKSCSLKSGLQTTRMTQSARCSFNTSNRCLKSTSEQRFTPLTGSFLSKHGPGTENERLAESSYPLTREADSPRPATHRPTLSAPNLLQQELFQDYLNIEINPKKTTLQSKAQRTEAIKINDNKGIFFDKIRHYSRIFNPKQKSQLIFDKIAKKPTEVEDKKQIRVVQATVKDYERDINQRLSTFSTFAMAANGWDEGIPLNKRSDIIRKKLIMNEMKPMTIADLWSKSFHTEIMTKAEHNLFRLRIERYLHILHSQGQSSVSISKLILDHHRNTNKLE